MSNQRSQECVVIDTFKRRSTPVEFNLHSSALFCIFFFFFFFFFLQLAELIKLPFILNKDKVAQKL